MEHMPADITVGDEMGEADPFGARSTFVVSDGSTATFVDIGVLERSGAVSYTHLTLPTIYSV